MTNKKEKPGKAKEKSEKKQNKKQEKEEEKQTEPELKIIREIKQELREIEQEEEPEQDEEEDFQEGFFIPESESGAGAPILKKTDLEQTLEEIESPEDRRKKEKEEDKEGVLKYIPDMESKYFTEESEEERKEDKREPNLLRVERAPEFERASPVERQLRAREKPVRFVEDWQEQESWKDSERVLKYEQAEPETHGSELPFSPKEIERRTKKYKKRL